MTARRFSAGTAVLVGCLITGELWAQSAGAALSGKVTDPSGAAVPNATISVKNTATGQEFEAQTDAEGFYAVRNLTAGDYEITASAKSLGATTSKTTLTAGAPRQLNLALPGAAGNAVEPSLSDLGFSPEQTQGNAQEQARLDKRSHMLKTHQRLGLITTAPLLATLITSAGTGGRHSTTGGRELHAALGSVTAGLYLTTASFAIFAPKIHGTETRGPIRLHKALAWIHGPGMILTPILGAMAYEQRSRGERVHGIAKAHGPAAIITAGAYGLAILSVSIKF